jgi:DNA-binding transcriptional LysR family regulator
MTLPWNLIHTFDAVAKTGSLLAAAKSLGLSQPTVGRHIDLLEGTLKMPLFVRSRDGMALTAAGSDLVETSADMVRAAQAFQRRAAGLDKEISGTVRLSANDVLGVHVLPGVLSDFMDAHPEVEVELDITNAPANLLRRDADIAVRMFRPVQNDLIARKVSDIALGFYAHSSYLEAHGRPKTLRDLSAHRFIGFDRETFNIDAARAFGLTLTASDFAFRCDSLLAHIEAVKAGLGVAILHQGLASPMAGVERVLSDVTLPSIELWLACHSDVQHNTRVRKLVDYLAERLRTPYPKLKNNSYSSSP